MTRRAGQLAFVLLGFACACSGRASLPSAVPPWTPSPDAEFRRSSPPPGPRPRAWRLLEPHEVRLANGLRVVVVERHDLPIVSVVYANRASALGEKPAEAGVKALTASLLNEGTRMDNGEVLRQLSANGVTPTVIVSLAGTELVANALATDLDATLRLLARVVRYPVFDAAEFSRARGAQMDALFFQSLDVEFHLRHAVLAELYGEEQPLARSVLGRSDSLKALTRASVAACHARHYGPADSVLVVAGATSAQAVRALAEQHFGDWQATEGYASATPNPPAVASTRRYVHGIVGGENQGYFVLGFAAVGPEHPDYLPLRIVATLLGRFTLSRAKLELRAHQGASYGVNAEYRTQPGSGQLLIAGDLNSDVLEKSVLALRTEVERLARAPLPPADLEAGKLGLLADLSSALSANTDVALRLARTHELGLPADFYAGLADRVHTITATDVENAVARHLTRERAALAVMAHPGHVTSQLATFGPVEWFTLHQKND